MAMNDLIKIERHFFENRNHTVRFEYRVYRASTKGAYTIRTKLSKEEQQFFDRNISIVFHF